MSADRVQSLYESTLKPRLAGLEGHRRTLRGYIIKAIASVAVPFVVFRASGAIVSWFGLGEGAAFAVSAVSFLGIFAGVIFAGVRFLLPGYAAYVNYKLKFKREVVSEIFKIVCPAAEYSPQHGMTRQIFIDCGIFDDRGSYDTDDRVRGRIGNTPFEAAEVKRQYSTGGKNSQTRTVFHGLFFHIDFNKALSGRTIVEPEKAQAYQIGDRRNLKLVTLENPDFEKEFKVYASNEVEARYILTPAMMEKLLALRRAAEHPVFLAFQKNRAYLGVHYGRSLFEPGIASTTSVEAIHEMAEHFGLAELVVNELDLNTRIWTKGVDDSLLKGADTHDDNPIEALAAAQKGDLTGADIWKAATDAVSDIDDEIGDYPRPPSTRIDVARGGSGATVSYGYSIGFFIVLLLSLFCFAATASAIRLLSETDMWPPDLPIPPLPAIPFVDDLVRMQPLAFLIPCPLVGAFLSLYWIFRVHKVEITPSTVYIHRGLRPVARRYPRPPYDSVVCLENSVHIGRTGALSLINPTASPNLRRDEAKWVASEMRKAMKQTMQSRALAILFVLGHAALAAAQGAYFPERFDWQRRTPEQAGMNAAAVDAAVKFAIANENPAPKDLRLAHAMSLGAEPFDTPIGPHKTRTGANGLIIRSGRVVAEWGDTRSVDMTFSVTKTFLSTVAGLAWQKGLIRDVTDRAGDYMPPDVDLFQDPHNRPITWEHLLRQTSDWTGTLWGKPDWADRPEGKPEEWANRRLYEPGTRYKYNDVRVNVLALALLHVLRRPLPEVLREEVMEPIGASSTWRWHGYENSWIDLDGRKVQSMTGGGHWGGGMFINAWDMARFGYLFLRNGRWKDRQVVSEKWIAMARAPGPANAEYGYANWFLNPGRKPLPAAPASSVTFRGNGQNIIYIDWENDLLVVVRWIGGGGALNEFLGKVVGAIQPSPSAR